MPHRQAAVSSCRYREKQVERLLSFRIKADQFADHYNQRSVLAKAKELRDRLTGMIEDDVTAFNAVMGR